MTFEAWLLSLNTNGNFPETREGEITKLLTPQNISSGRNMS